MSGYTLQALYADDDHLMKAVRETRDQDHHISEVYTPFPVHGLDKAAGIKETRMAITAFLYGLVGFGIAVWMMNFMMIEDWPRNIGGKPSFTFFQNMPAFVPIMFELTVFFAAHLMVITFYMRSKIWPFKQAENPDPRTTDDHFVMEVETDKENIQDVAEFLHSTGAKEVDLKR
jgi:hypothetical protein